MPKNTRILIISALATIIALTIGWLTLDGLMLRLTATNPTSDKVSTVAPFIDFYFNHNIEKIDSAKLDNNKIDTKITNNQIRIMLPKDLSSQSEHAITIQGVKSSFRSIGSVTFKFTPKYIEYKELPEDTRKYLTNESNSGQIDDPFLDNAFPITPVTEDFTIDFTTNNYTNRAEITVSFLAEAPNDETGETPQLSNEEAERMRTRLLDYIKSQQGKPENYDITYSNLYLNKKYAGIE